MGDGSLTAATYVHNDVSCWPLDRMSLLALLTSQKRRAAEYLAVLSSSGCAAAAALLLLIVPEAKTALCCSFCLLLSQNTLDVAHMTRANRTTRHVETAAALMAPCYSPQPAVALVVWHCPLSSRFVTFL